MPLAAGDLVAGLKAAVVCRLVEVRDGMDFPVPPVTAGVSARTARPCAGTVR
jgi:hypothetical protein